MLFYDSLTVAGPQHTTPIHYCKDMEELWIFNLGGVPIPSLLANEFDDAATRFLNLNYAEKLNYHKGLEV